MNNVHFAIPEIYGETLSYYELLRKLVDKTNELIENYNTVPDQIDEAVKKLDASQLFSAVLNQLIHSIATDNTKSAYAVKVYKKHDLLYATFNETVNLYESLIDFSTATETELIVGSNIREVNISELFIELRKLIDINKNNIEAVTAVANENSSEITTMHNDITSIENKNTEQDNEITTMRTMISSPYNFKGDVANKSALPASGEVNDTYYVQDVKYKVTWNGSAWVQSSLSEADYETELGELKDDLDELNIIPIKNKVVKIDAGHYWDNAGNLVENLGYDAVTIEVEGGKSYSINKNFIPGQNFNIFTDSAGNVIGKYTSDNVKEIGNGWYFTAIEGAKYLKGSRGINTYFNDFVVIEGIRDISKFTIQDYPIGEIKKEHVNVPFELMDGTVVDDALKKHENHLTELDSIFDKVPLVIYCGESRDYKTLKGAIEEATKYMDATVYVDEGTYDLVEEFSTDYLDSYNGTDNIGLFLKNRVRVVFSSGAKVVFDYQGTNGKVHEYFSPFNSGKYGFTLENAYVESKNCRYSVHDERAHATDSYHNTYKRCTFIHDSSQASGWHASQAIGGGLGKYGDILIEDCYCKSVRNDDTISYHSTTISEDGNDAKSKIVVRGTYTTGTLCFIPLGNSTEKTPIFVSDCNLRIEPKLSGSADTMELISWGNTIRSAE